MKSNHHYSRLLSEVLHDPRFAMEERRFYFAASLVMTNLQNGVALEFEPKTLANILSFPASSDGKEFNLSNASSTDFTCSSEMQAALQGDAVPQDHVFINSVYICGTMTREGDACTYGSKEHKEMMMDAADDPRCRGHILLINSGGGAVGTLMDYREAINYCLERGQNVVAVVDECAASAACFTANMANRIFATRETDEVGSLGMFAIFTTIADGTVIPQTNEVIHIRYAEQSKDKNYAIREAADGNNKPIDEMLKNDLDEILANTKKDRKCLLPEQLTGKMYRARDVMGSMVDEIGDVDAAVDWLMNDWNARNGAPLPVKATADDTQASPSNAPSAPVNEPEPKDPSNEPDPNAPSNEPSNDPDPEDDDTASSQTTNIQTSNSMQQYTAIPSAIGEEPMETLGELTLQAEQAEALEQAIVASNSRIAELESQLASAQQQIASNAETHQTAIDQLNAEHQTAIDALNAEHATAIEALNAEHSQQVDTLNAEHQTAIDNLNAEHQTAIDALNAEHQTAISEANAAATEAQQNLADANQRINDLTAEVESLNNAQGNQPQAGHQPASNGQQPAQQATIVSSHYTYDPTLSARQNADRRKQMRQ